MNAIQLDPPAAADLSPLDVALATEEIRALKARYFRLMDVRDWAGWRALFTADAVMDMRDEAASMRALGFTIPDEDAMRWHGADGIARAVSEALVGVVTVHHGHMDEISVETAVAASGIWAMEDVIRYGPGAPVAGFHGYGHYHDRYRVEDGAWRIASTRLARLLVTPVPHAGGTAPARV